MFFKHTTIQLLTTVLVQLMKVITFCLLKRGAFMERCSKPDLYMHMYLYVHTFQDIHAVGSIHNNYTQSR